MAKEATNAQEHEVIREEQTTNYPCESCGGKMVFNPEKGTLRCGHCESEMQIESAMDTPVEHDFLVAPRAGAEDWGKGTRVMKCESCGAQTVLDDVTTSSFCIFCGSPHITKDTSNAGIAPETLIPFSIGIKTAIEAYEKWLKKRYFAPRKLRTAARQGKLNGLYLPHWTYDAVTDSNYHGMAGHHYWVTESYTTTENGKSVRKTRQVRKTRWVPTAGMVSKIFDDVLVVGTKNMDKKLLNGIRPFDLGKLVKFSSEFLSGFFSEKASVNIDEGWSDAKVKIDNDIRDACHQDIRRYADESQVSNVKTRYEDIKYKLMVLPIWISSYKYKDKTYQFMVNGQTGKVSGKSPISPFRVAIAVLVFLLLALVVLFIAASLAGDSEVNEYSRILELLL